MSRLPLHPTETANPNLRGPANDRDLEARIASLERRLAANVRVVNTASSSFVDLGAVDGPNITGIRVAVQGVMSNVTAGGGGAKWYWRINGGTITLASYILKYAHWSTPTFNNNIGESSGDLTTRGGLPMGIVGFSSVGQTNYISSDSTLFTSTSSGNVATRHSVSQAASSDGSNNGNNWLVGEAYGNWYDSTTAITSIGVLFDGTFNGRVSMEIIP